MADRRQRRGPYRSFLNIPDASLGLNVPRTSRKRNIALTGEESLADDDLTNVEEAQSINRQCHSGFIDTDQSTNSPLGIMETENTSEQSEPELELLEQRESYSTEARSDSFSLDSGEDQELNDECGDIQDEDDFLVEVNDGECDSKDAHGCKEDSFANQPLFQGCPLTVVMHLVSVITFAMAQRLTGTALAHLLELIYLHCPTPNNCTKSVKKLWNFFTSLRTPIEWHYVCSYCRKYLGNSEPSNRDNCPYCMKTFSEGRLKSWYPFIVFPLFLQLKCMFQEKGFFDLLNYRFKHEEEKRKNEKSNYIDDIIDGRNYKYFYGQPGSQSFLRNPNNVSFLVNTDGVALFKSSKFSIWPVYMVICELPPRLRYTRKYRLFAGLWFGFTKPVFSSFIEPFRTMMQNLYKEGFTVKSPDFDDEIVVRGITISSSMDAPAKCLFMCMTQFNGKFGCPYCEAPGSNFRTDKGGNCHVYSYIKEKDREREAQPRNHKEFLKDAKEAATRISRGQKNSAVNGVKGVSAAFGLPGYDLVAGSCIDYMHTVLLGVTKQLMTYWFDRKFKGSPYFCGDQLKECDNRRENIKPPNSVGRIPRSLTEMVHYKASEFRTWLLYYSLPVMKEVLPVMYFDHFILFVCAIFLCLKKSISPPDLELARKLLEHFCLRASCLYGKRFETFNVHQLLHITENVRNNGPLWATSCFFFEDLNGDLRSLFHGSQNVESQIIKATSILQHLPRLHDELPNSEAKDFCKSLVTTKEKGYITETISEEDKLYTIGALKNALVDNDDEIEQLELAFGDTLVNSNYKIFYRLKQGKDIIHSVRYTRETKRNTTAIMFVGPNACNVYGSVQYFVKYTPCIDTTCFERNQCFCKGSSYYAVVKRFSETAPLLTSSSLQGPLACVTHLIPVKKENIDVVCIPVETIVSTCFLIDTCKSDVMFVGMAPNTVERE